MANHHILQSWSWGELKAQTSWNAERLVFKKGENLIGAASVLTRTLPGAAGKICYVPKGPLLCKTDPASIDYVLSCLEKYGKDNKGAYIKIDPDLADSDDVKNQLSKRKWIKGDDIQFKNTVRISLLEDDEQVLGRMKSKTRYNIRLAKKKGVEIRVGTVEDLPLFYELYQDTGNRGCFTVRPFSYYEPIWKQFLEEGKAALFLASYQEDTVSAVLAFIFGKTVWYFYGASIPKHRNKMPAYLVQWEAMQWAKQNGAQVYDMWGAPTVMDESDPLWGVYRFKSGFGGEFTEHIGAWDFPIKPMRYKIITRAIPGLMQIWKKLKGEPSLKKPRYTK